MKRVIKEEIEGNRKRVDMTVRKKRKVRSKEKEGRDRYAQIRTGE